MKVYVLFEVSDFRDDRRFVGIFWSAAEAERRSERLRKEQSPHSVVALWTSYVVEEAEIEGSPLAALAREAE